MAHQDECFWFPAHLYHPTYLINWWVPGRFCSNAIHVLYVIAKLPSFAGKRSIIQWTTWISLLCFVVRYALFSRDWPSKSGLRAAGVRGGNGKLRKAGFTQHYAGRAVKTCTPHPKASQDIPRHPKNARIFPAFCGIHHYSCLDLLTFLVLL